MGHYVSGSGVPIGETAYIEGFPGGPWYGEYRRQATPPYAGPDEAPQLQCPTMVPQGPSANPDWYDFTSYSYAVIGAKLTAGRWVYGPDYYPSPDRMTHPPDTVMLMDMATPAGAAQPHAWVEFNRTPGDPHLAKSNYMFVDGHCEFLDAGSITADMWESMR